MRHLLQIFERLQLSREKGLFFLDENRWSGLFSNRVEKLLRLVIKPDAFFCMDNKPLILFFEDLQNKKKKLKEIWNFNESPIVFIAEKGNIEIYNGFNYLQEKGTLQLLGTENQLDNFSYYKLVTGESWDVHDARFSYDKRIDFHLLANIKTARKILVDVGLTKEFANSLLGKVIFVRYLIDRNVKLDFEQKGSSKNWTTEELCALLRDRNKIHQFFNYLKEKFNGDLFPISNYDFDSFPSEAFEVIRRLLLGDHLESGQKSLFDLYDFSIVPVEFISNVYELFIGEKEQEKEGAYYTPLFLVDYIQAETVENKIRSEHKKNFNCKVLDPSCGSGIFLVETLRKIIEKFQKNNPEILEVPEKYKLKLKELVVQNIFGVDKDRNAINVAIFSIYLTLLDYQNPSDIESFKFPLLYGKNFFSSDFFDKNAAFNAVLKGEEFDFILGNPPWKRGRGENSKPLFVEYIKDRKKTEKEKKHAQIEISNSEIAQAFVLRVSDFASERTRIALIITSKMLYNINGKKFRRYLLDQYKVNRIFELAPVRKEVFDKSNDKAVAPAAVLFYQYANGKNVDKNIIEHITLKPSPFFSLFKIFTIQRNDYKHVTQEKLKNHDFLWKTLVYGNYLDFNLVKRLKEEYTTINELISNKNEYVFGQGMQVGGGDKNDATRHLAKKFISTNNDVKSFWVNELTAHIWEKAVVHRERSDLLFKAPMVLMKKGFDKNFRCVSGYLREDAVFTDSLTAIKTTKKSMEPNLRIISGLLNSSVFAYLNLQTFSSSGIEREQAHNKEKFSMPFIANENIEAQVSELMSIQKKRFGKTKLMSIDLQFDFEKKLKELDNLVMQCFSFSSVEKEILSYSLDVVVPTIMKQNGYKKLFLPIRNEEKELKEYAQLFFDRFNSTFEKLDQKLVLHVRHTKQIIGLFFKLIPLKEESESIYWIKEEKESILKLLLSMGINQITDRLFIQKDVRGFEESGFYIVKPNEKRLWHKAIGLIDVDEFLNAILIAGKNMPINVR